MLGAPQAAQPNTALPVALAAAVLVTRRLPLAPAAAACLQSTVKLLIDGQFVESNTKEWIDVTNPATQVS